MHSPRPKLLDQLQFPLRGGRSACRSENAIPTGFRRLILFHQLRCPAGTGGPETEAFLTPLAVRNCSPQNQEPPFRAD
jgi:hypothetical protein